MAKPPDFIDRKSEIDLFEAIVNRQRIERLLTLLIGPEKGKSYLMNYLWGHCREKQVPVAMIDFDKREKGGVYYWKFVRDVCEQIGINEFSDVNNCIKRHGEVLLPLIHIQTGTGQAGVEFGEKGNFQEATMERLSGRDHVDVKMGDITLHEAHGESAGRKERLMDELGRAFQSDLAKVCAQCQIVLLLDTFEQAFLETRQWIDEWLFSRLPTHYKNLIVVVAGRPTGLHEYFDHPKPWHSLMFLREDLSRPPEEEVKKYVELWQLPVANDDEMRPFIMAAQNNMATLAKLRDLYRKYAHD